MPMLNQGELAVLFCFVFLYFVFSGPGAWSVDSVRARRR
jgi:putative oxidoreductase